MDTVQDGAAAYDYASTGAYDALVLDVVMPKLDGVEVLRRLRADGIRTPAMMLTAKSQKDDRITGFNAGADDYLPKPFEPDELICRVRAMLLVLAVVWLFSRRAIDPVVKSIEQQKQFITDAGHERKTPITVISTSLKVLEMETGKQKWIDKAQAQTDKLTELVNALVTLSRMDEEHSPLRMSRFAVSEAVGETAESFRDFGRRRGIR